MAVIALLALTGCGGGDPEPAGRTAGVTGGRAGATVVASGRALAPTPSMTATSTGGERPTDPTPTATGSGVTAVTAGIADFVRAARAADARLRTAASLVNGSVTTTAVRVRPATAAAVKAAAPQAVARTLPAGLPPAVLGAAVTVYSDLVSRHAAMSRFEVAGTWSRSSGDPVLARETAEKIACLGNGTEAARRFAADLDALRRVAASTGTFRMRPLDSRAAAEVLLLATYVDVGNRGCDSCGGGVVTRLPSITWRDGSARSLSRGTVGGVDFEARYTASGWKVQLIAC